MYLLAKVSYLKSEYLAALGVSHSELRSNLQGDAPLPKPLEPGQQQRHLDCTGFSQSRWEGPVVLVSPELARSAISTHSPPSSETCHVLYQLGA